MSTKRKRNSGDPRKHPGQDELDVLYPDPHMALPPSGVDLDTWFEQHPPEFKTNRVTRDECDQEKPGLHHRPPGILVQRPRAQ